MREYEGFQVMLLLFCFFSNHVELIRFLFHAALCYTETIMYLGTKRTRIGGRLMCESQTWEDLTWRIFQETWWVLRVSCRVHYKCSILSFDLRSLPYEWIFIIQFWGLDCLLRRVLFIVVSCFLKKWSLCIWCREFQSEKNCLYIYKAQSPGE